jgi:hypothetical protein
MYRGGPPPSVRAFDPTGEGDRCPWCRGHNVGSQEDVVEVSSPFGNPPALIAVVIVRCFDCHLTVGEVS